MYEGSNFSAHVPNFLNSFLIAILRAMWQHLMVILICISLNINDFEHIFMCFWPCVCVCVSHSVVSDSLQLPAMCIASLKKYQLVYLCSLFLYNKFIYFYFWLRCCTQAFSSCSEQGLVSIVVVQGCSRRLLLLQSTGSRVQGLIAVVHRLNCPVGCRIFPDGGSDPCAPHWQADS